ncbi:MAG: hypothetical protein ACXWG0_02730 [Chthoniobacterales bacterium]
MVLAATLQAMPAYRLETAPASNGFQNTQIGYSDIANRPAQSPTLTWNGTRFELVQTNSSGYSSAAGGFGGSTSPFNRPELGPPIVGTSALGGFGGEGAQTNGPALPVPEPSSSWLLLALAVIPILKIRSSRKSRAS